MEYEIPRFCCDALLIISISEDYFNILDEDLHPLPDRKSLVCAIGRQCLRLLRRCIHGNQNHSAAARGYVECEDMNVIINIPEISGGDQSARGIVGLFENLMKDLNSSFWPDGPDKWEFNVTELRPVFEKLSMGLEASLTDMREDAQPNQITSVHAIKSLRQEGKALQLDSKVPQQRAHRNDIATDDLLDDLASISI